MYLMRLTIFALIIVGASLSPRSEAGSICLSASDGCGSGPISGSPYAPIMSTGADGAFQALTDTTLVAGTYNFTDVLIGANATLSFMSTGAPQDIYLLSASDVTIYGNIIANGDNLYIGVANNFLLVGTGTIDVTGGALTIDSGVTQSINGSIITGTTNNNNGGIPPVIVTGGGPVLSIVPVPPSLFLLLSGLPLLIRRRSR